MSKSQEMQPEYSAGEPESGPASLVGALQGRVHHDLGPARVGRSVKSGSGADEASRVFQAPTPRGSLPNSLGNEHLYQSDQEWVCAPLGASQPPSSEPAAVSTDDGDDCELRGGKGEINITDLAMHGDVPCPTCISRERAAQPPVPDYAHIANEWADMATNGIQWLRNIRDGISTPAEALAEMEDNHTRIQKLRAALTKESAP